MPGEGSGGGVKGGGRGIRGKAQKSQLVQSASQLNYYLGFSSQSYRFFFFSLLNTEIDHYLVPHLSPFVLQCQFYTLLLIGQNALL